MSFTKKIYEDNIINNVEKINKTTTDDIDITPLLDLIDATLDVLEKISIFDNEISEFWNEISSDVIASVYSATSGFYRQAIITLRNILEIGCLSFFYLDHKIEYHLFKSHDAKADKYVSVLIREFNFFTTNYIHAFYLDIKSKQSSVNSISNYLSSLYKQLSDIVHGRYKTLTKKSKLLISYDRESFHFFIDKFKSVIGILVAMYILRYNDKENMKLIEIANSTGAVCL